MNFGYFIAAIVLYAVSYVLGIVGGFVKFPVALIVTNLGSMVLKLVSVILVIVGVYKIIKGPKKKKAPKSKQAPKKKGSKFTNIEDDYEEEAFTNIEEEEEAFTNIEEEDEDDE